MPRKKKIKQEGENVFSMKFDRQIPNTPIVKKTSNGWVSYGRRNDYPDLLLGLYAQSPTLSACVNFCTTALVGNGVDYQAMSIDGSQLMPNYRMDWNTFIRRCAFDYFLFGNFAIQVIKNRDGKTYSFYYQPINTVRSGVRDEDGMVTDYYICSDWTATSKYPPVEIPSLTMRDDGEWNIKAGEPYLLVPDTYSPLSDYYATPIWNSALKSVQAETEFLSYDLKTTSNVFCPAGALSLPPADSEEQKQAILRNIQDMFSGADGAQQLLISFRSDSEDEPVKFTPFTASSDNVNLFDSANDRNINRILSTFSIPSRALIGLPLENVGFSSESAILETAFELYNTLKGNESRNAVIGVINTLFRANGIDTEIVMKPLVFGTTTQTETAGPNTDISDDNIIEQEQGDDNQ